MNKQLNTLQPELTVTLTDEERQPCEIWTRVMGYHRPISSFNKGKQSEFRERRYFREESYGDSDARQ